ncbi:MAG: hypothetical protein A2928_03140 [Candidatus Taylorbacteria bacterium RIFCSPLOWO2_01_FULL_45_15b]|uniref:D-lactate dehydrogenase (cytochrome) n=1 Tax=Candidatus Taylorbacteria bacterium RIFCSPLOWO2_01_FULL_45_15b TaxID=1802319 RepID=A0A1G2NDT9_9BACT|nr:MAG: hypothetical protein A2928_03140 [Candidatus Taylorbacteria bacterium RIFCSPLOWO2_01_FULL_45_15b]
MGLKQELQAIIGGEVIDSAKERSHYSRDASIFEVKPKVIVKAKDVRDISNLVRFVSEAKKSGKKISLAPRAAGTCMSGGSLTESISLDVLNLNSIGEITGDRVAVGPGAFYRDLEDKTLLQGLIMPAYTASKKLCTVGGMVANNSSGEKTLVYGDTSKYVKKLKVILADGNEYEFGPLSAPELIHKKHLGTFEGEVYRKMHDMLDDHFSKIMGARPAVSKNSAGYLLWDVWDRRTFDLTKLFCGSQGTLGIITEIELALVPKHTHTKLLVITLDTLDVLPEIVARVLIHKPETFESFDDNTFSLAAKYMKEDTSKVITKKEALLTLIAEFAGENEVDANKVVEAARDALKGLPVEMQICETDEEEESYWNIRRSSFKLLREHVEGTHSVAPFVDDIIVRPEFLPQFLPKLEAILKEFKLIYTIAGHIGNGNFHLIPLMDMTSEKDRDAIVELSRRIFALVFEYKGSMAGEHNDGIIRTPFLEAMYGKEICELFRKTKEIFDPLNIFNPGKKVGGTVEFAKAHFAKKNEMPLY